MSISKAIEQIPSENRRFPQNVTRIDRLYSSYIGPDLLVSLHFIIN